MNRRNLLGLAMVGSLTAGLVACGSDEDPLATGDSPTGDSTETTAIIVGSANFPESELLAEMYCQVLETAGVEVTRQFNIGAREIYLKALDDGSIDLLPEYNGSLLAYLADGGAPEGVVSPEDVYDALQDVLPEGIETLEQAAAEDKDTLTVSRATATQYNLATLDDLAAVSGDLVAGGGPEFQERYQGLVGLQEVYGIEFKEWRSLDPGGPLTVAALADGTIQVANLFSTDSAIVTNDFVPLEDTKSLFLAENIVPVIRSSKNDQTVTDALNSVSAVLTTDNLTEYLAKVQVDKQSSAAVATEFLTANGLA